MKFDTVQQMVDWVIKNTSPAEMAHIKAGNLATAEWIADKVLDLTPTQVESVAFRVWEQVKP